jgi:hypothetical protein
VYIYSTGSALVQFSRLHPLERIILLAVAFKLDKNRLGDVTATFAALDTQGEAGCSGWR